VQSSNFEARINGPVEQKTGTRQSHKDAWFVGFTDHVVVGTTGAIYRLASPLCVYSGRSYSACSK
jgi:membrane carboxypeptidase/penicillin-binding protein PbpC